MLLTVYRNTEGIHLVRLDAVKRTLVLAQIRLKAVHPARRNHAVDNPPTLQPLTELLAVQASIFHAEYTVALSHIQFLQPTSQLAESLLVVVNPDMAVLPVNGHSVIVGNVKPMLRHVNPKVQFVAHLFFLYILLSKGIRRWPGKKSSLNPSTEHIPKS